MEGSYAYSYHNNHHVQEQGTMDTLHKNSHFKAKNRLVKCDTRQNQDKEVSTNIITL